MKELLNNPGFIAIFGTIFGGVGLKIAEGMLARAKDRQQEAMYQREEYRKEVQALRDQLAASALEERRLEAMAEEWRAKYYDLRDEKQKVVTELTIVMDRLKALDAAKDS